MKYTVNFLQESHSKSLQNKTELLESNLCGCFHCMKTFTPSKIKSWIKEQEGKEDSAWCPICGMDTVLSETLPITDKAFLKQMNQYWFDKS